MPDAINLRILGDNGTEGLSADQTVQKPLSFDVPDQRSVDLLDATKVEDACVHWSEATDLSHIPLASLKRRSIAVMQKHAGIYTGRLGHIRATEHRIALHLEIKPIRQPLYSAGPMAPDFLELYVQKQLYTGIIEPPQTEWTTPVIISPKRYRTIRFCVHSVV